MDSLQFAPDRMTSIGQLYGHYQIEKPLGYGAFAAVWLGRHQYLGTKAAIKILHPTFTDEEEARFQAEASIMFRLKHPNIVQALDYGFKFGAPYLIVEYAPFGTLGQLYPRGRAFPLDAALSYAWQIARGLDYIHARGYIHRDIKPQNLLIGRNREILIGDFGIALEAGAMAAREEAAILGTPTYMAPEQINGHSCFASDQYALAIVIYELLSGTAPFEGTGTDMVEQHLNSTPLSLRALDSSITPAVEDVIMRGLAKQPEHRYATCCEFVAALEQAAAVPAQTSYFVPTRKTARPATPGAERKTSPRSHHRERKTARWLTITALLTADLSGAAIIGLLCAALHVPAATTTSLLSFCLTGVLLAGAFILGSRLAWALAAGIFSASLIVGFALHSTVAFPVTFMLLLFSCAPITLSLFLHRSRSEP